MAGRDAEPALTRPARAGSQPATRRAMKPPSPKTVPTIGEPELPRSENAPAISGGAPLLTGP